MLLAATAIARRSWPRQAAPTAARFRRHALSSSPRPVPAGAAAHSPTTPTPLDVLYEDKHLIVINKPAGLLSQGAAAPPKSSETGAGATAETDMLTLVRTHLAAAAGKPSVYLGLVHRLDRNVSGAMVFAKRSKAAARLSEAFRAREVRKVYVAVVVGAVRVGETRTLRHVLVFSSGKGKGNGRDQGSGFVTRVVRDAPAATTAGEEGEGDEEGSSHNSSKVLGTLRYTPLLVVPRPQPQQGEKHQTLLRVELLSGRKHQIRAQLSHVGHPIVGDVKYGAPTALRDKSIALHCRTLAFAHPKKGEQRDEGEGGNEGEGGERRMVVVDAPLPAAWRARFGEAAVAVEWGVKG